MKEDSFSYYIIVNGAKHIVEGDGPISYEELVRMAFGSKADVNFIYTMVWEKLKGRHSGHLLPGQKITKSTDLIVSVADTSKA